MKTTFLLKPFILTIALTISGGCVKRTDVGPTPVVQSLPPNDLEQLLARHLVIGKITSIVDDGFLIESKSVQLFVNTRWTLMSSQMIRHLKVSTKPGEMLAAAVYELDTAPSLKEIAGRIESYRQYLIREDSPNFFHQDSIKRGDAYAAFVTIHKPHLEATGE